MRAGMEQFINNPIYTITAEAMSNGRDNIEVVGQMLKAGIKFIQYREKTKPALDRYNECLKLRQMTRDNGAIFIIDDFIDLAMAVDADGVHIGQTDLPAQVVRQLIGNDKIIGLSTHNEEQLQKANMLGDIIDYIGVGPVYATQTKKNAVPVGFSYVEYATKNSKHPFVAIGGIKEHNICDVAAHGAKTFAIVSEIVGADDIVGKINSIKNTLQKK
ncbi:Thiamine-phosphate synthase [Megamonas hypermegale]|uniref:Thiamine-phosphate synthase n=1 Tax=Megamonas hypermegale TaxID=158847 RepID=A0A239TWW0_9FIRM|nr:thiamine phosphate synthase [Megamonas hypermegale]SNV02260.1 Thiamine-phosphate synthase [Megamonas hypermegale]